ncbi:uncharacterized protein LOC134684358 [Mytilus trossulus]|uniref:uncharacterized protein LOC134684358 n=1 Tax=Mytilus trossulus TaxID=6551 RepID=UPI003003D9A3
MFYSSIGCSKKSCRFLDGCVFLQNDGYCMKYYVRQLSYEPASTVCRQDGGELFRIDSYRKQLAMEHILSSVLSVTDDVIVQGTKDSQDRWLFDDGTPMTYFNWNSPDGQPNNGPTERYIHIKSSNQCLWNDFGSAERQFLCQINENN